MIVFVGVPDLYFCFVLKGKLTDTKSLRKIGDRWSRSQQEYLDSFTNSYGQGLWTVVSRSSSFFHVCQPSCWCSWKQNVIIILVKMVRVFLLSIWFGVFSGISKGEFFGISYSFQQSALLQPFCPFRENVFIK